MPTPNRIWNVKWADRTLALLFSLFCATPFIVWLSGFDKEALAENRTLTLPPSWEKDSFESMPARIDAYYRDRLGFRSRLIRWQSEVRHLWLGGRSDSVVMGKDRWLFYAKDDALGLKPFAEDEIASLQMNLEERSKALAAAGVKYLFVAAPDKQSVYPEMLAVHRAGSRLDRLLERLETTNSPVDVLDLRGALIAAKSNEMVYFPHDTHWNGYGALAAHREMLRRLNKPTGEDYEVRRQSCSFGDWLLLGLPEENAKYPCDIAHRRAGLTAQRVDAFLPSGVVGNPARPPIKTVQPGAAGSLLVLHDSFMHAGFADESFTPLSDQFGSVFYYSFKVTNAQLLSLARAEHADVVLEEIVERDLR